MEFRLLGPIEVIGDDGASIPLGGARPRALLAQLLLNANDVVSTDRLIDGIWGEQPPASAASALQVHVHALRRTIGPDRIVTRPPGYVVRVDADELDVDRFARLVADGDPHGALALWRGQALADLAFEPFAQAEAARLEEARLATLEARIDADLDAGRHGALTGELDTLAAAHPHRERLQAQRMLALYRAGRQADALAAYREAREALDELGLEPSAELRALERRILEQDPSLEPVSARRRSSGSRRDGARRPQARAGRDPGAPRPTGRASAHAHRHRRERQDPPRPRRRGRARRRRLRRPRPARRRAARPPYRRDRARSRRCLGPRAGGAARRARNTTAAPRPRQSRAPARGVRGGRSAARGGPGAADPRHQPRRRSDSRSSTSTACRRSPCPELGVETAAEADSDAVRLYVERARARAARVRAHRRERERGRADLPGAGRATARDRARRGTGARARARGNREAARGAARRC